MHPMTIPLSFPPGTPFGRIVAALLEREGLSYADLAERLGVTRQAVYNIVDSDSITERTLNKVLNVLGYSITIEGERNE